MIFLYVFLTPPVILFLYIGTPYIYKFFYKKSFIRKTKKSNKVFITFDDGPDPLATKRILDILHDAGVKATFFLVGKKAEEHPELTREIIQEGHNIGFHSYNHTFPFYTGPVTTFRDMSAFKSVIQGNSEQRIFFRPPFGKFNIIGLLYVLFHGWPIVLWDNDPRDYAASDPNVVVSQVLNDIGTGSVILFHDGRDRHTNHAVTIDAVSELLKRLSEREIQPAKIEELFQ